MRNQQVHERMAAWIILLILALILGLPFNPVTIFWVGILSAWVMSGGSKK